ncbi:MAG: hypothetical protein JSV16_15400 [Candidatus Hydrogenedentota bacterium]|nr:MAG: hypothetical protein JSV16_15400 [Candidatus Hydrogenedentota bacterium]
MERKTAEALLKAPVYCDAAISLPMVVHALAQRNGELITSRKASKLRLTWPEN